MPSKLMSLELGSLACELALPGAGGQGAGGNGAEQDGRGERGPGEGEGDEIVFGGLGKPRCRFMICSLCRDLLA